MQAAVQEVAEQSAPELIVPRYCEDVYRTKRRPTRTVKVCSSACRNELPQRLQAPRCLHTPIGRAEVFRQSCVQVGNVNIGSEHKIALQTMTTCDTRDIEGTVAEVKRCADAGADLVRLTVQGKKEAEACIEIRERLFKVCAPSSRLHAFTQPRPRVACMRPPRCAPAEARWTRSSWSNVRRAAGQLHDAAGRGHPLSARGGHDGGGGVREGAREPRQLCRRPQDV